MAFGDYEWTQDWTVKQLKQQQLKYISLVVDLHCNTAVPQ